MGKVPKIKIEPTTPFPMTDDYHITTIAWRLENKIFTLFLWTLGEMWLGSEILASWFITAN